MKAMRCLLSLMRVERALALALRVAGESWSSGRAMEGAESAITGLGLCEGKGEWD